MMLKFEKEFGCGPVQKEGLDPHTVQLLQATAVWLLLQLPYF